jgi:hypothetical protein
MTREVIGGGLREESETYPDDFASQSDLPMPAMLSLGRRSTNRDPGVIVLQQRKRFFPFHLVVPPKVKILSAHRDELGTYNAARGDESSRIMRLRIMRLML